MAERSAPTVIVFAISNASEIAADQRARKFFSERVGQTMSGDDADAGADHLDGSDERPGDERRPKDCCAQLRADHRVSADGRRIVIGRTGD